MNFSHFSLKLSDSLFISPTPYISHFHSDIMAHVSDYLGDGRLLNPIIYFIINCLFTFSNSLLSLLHSPLSLSLSLSHCLLLSLVSLSSLSLCFSLPVTLFLCLYLCLLLSASLFLSLCVSLLLCSLSTSLFPSLLSLFSPASPLLLPSPSPLQVHRLVLVDEEKHPCGIVSLSDILQALVLTPAGIDALNS
ncbi:hypothetical protein FKM82_016038 [Ascaphus truei]